MTLFSMSSMIFILKPRSFMNSAIMGTSAAPHVMVDIETSGSRNRGRNLCAASFTFKWLEVGWKWISSQISRNQFVGKMAEQLGKIGEFQKCSLWPPWSLRVTNTHVPHQGWPTRSSWRSGGCTSCPRRRVAPTLLRRWINSRQSPRVRPTHTPGGDVK